jgi:hypothetical protein
VREKALGRKQWQHGKSQTQLISATYEMLYRDRHGIERWGDIRQQRRAICVDLHRLMLALE